MGVGVSLRAQPLLTTNLSITEKHSLPPPFFALPPTKSKKQAYPQIQKKPGWRIGITCQEDDSPQFKRAIVPRAKAAAGRHTLAHTHTCAPYFKLGCVRIVQMQFPSREFRHCRKKGSNCGNINVKRCHGGNI